MERSGDAPVDPPRLLDRHRATLLTLGCAYLAVVTVVPIVTTPYRSDDLISRDVGQAFADSGLSVQGYLWEWVEPWITRDGRFFPGSAAWTFLVFTSFETREQYKVFVAALVLLMVALVTALVVTVVRAPVAPVAVVALTSTLTLRNWFDGLDTFSGILPLTACLTFGAWLLMLRGRGAPSALVAAALWGYALVTYEVAIVLAPTIVLVVWWARRRWVRTLPMVVPTVVTVALVAVLRARATGSDGNAYRVNLEPWRVLVTYTKQTAAALPLSEQWFPGSVGLDVDAGLLALTAAVVGVPAMLVLVVAARSPVPAGRAAIAVAALVGASLWLLPPVLIGVSLGWQNELPRGQGYVSVVWGYLGVAVLAAAWWSALARDTGSPHPWPRRAALHGTSAVLALLAAATVAQSVTIAVLLQATPA